MLDADMFVGSVAIVFGALVASAAIFNWEWYYQLKKVRWIESLSGRTLARVFFMLLGFGLIVLGGVIAIGLLSNESVGAVRHSRHNRVSEDGFAYRF